MANSFVSSTIWSISQRYLPSFIHILSTLLITRMITPSDFGEVAIATTFNQIAILLVASGLSEGLIYHGNKSRTLYSSAFYFNIAVSLTIYSVIYFSSERIAHFYSIDRLSILSKIICLNIVIYAFSYIQRTIYQRDLQFKRMAIISLVSSVLGSGVGIFMAFNEYGVWSIVALTLIINLSETLLLWCFSRWHPSLNFSFKELWEIIPYSLRLLANNFVQVIYDNIYTLVIGKYMGSRPLGFYNRMQTVAFYTTTNFVYSIESVFFPILCSNKNDKQRLTEAYEKLLRLCVLLAAIVLIILIVLSKQIVVLILTEKWLAGAPVLRYIAIAFLAVPVVYINNAFLKLGNRTDVLLYSNLIKKIIGISILGITVATQDLDIVCIGVIVYYLVDAIVSMICTHRFLNISFSRQLRFLCNDVLVLLATAGMGFWVVSWIEAIIPAIVVCTIVIVTIPFVLMRLFRMKEFFLLKGMLLKKKTL